MTVQSILYVWLIVTLAVVGIWDVYCLTAGIRDESVSHAIADLIDRVPIWGFWLGVLIGHIFIPLKVHAKPTGDQSLRAALLRQSTLTTTEHWPGGDQRSGEFPRLFSDDGPDKSA